MTEAKDAGEHRPTKRDAASGSLEDLANSGGALGMPETTPIYEEGVPPTGPEIVGDADIIGGTTGVSSTGATTEDAPGDEPGIE